MNLFTTILKQELKINFKSKSKIIANILYFCMFLAIFEILTQNLEAKNNHNLFIISLILALLLAIICINNDFLGRDNRDGTLEQAIIFCRNLEIYFCAKCLANWISSCLGIILSATLIYQIKDFKLVNLWQILAILTLSSLALNFLIALCETISIIGALSATIFIIALPLVLPILIITALSFDDFANNIFILLALTSLLISLSCLAGASIIKASNY